MESEEKLFHENTNLAYWFLHKHFPVYSQDEDVKQICLMALWKACKKFDPDKGFAFSTFAVGCMTNAVLMYFRDEKRRNRVQFVDNEIYIDGDVLNLFDTIADNPKGEVSLNFYIDELSPRLDAKERQALTMRIAGYKQREISEAVGVSRAQVCRYFKRIREKI